MQLAEYLEKTGETQVEFSKRSGVAQAVVCRVVRGGDAQGKNWARIEDATNGEVSVADHFGGRDE